MRHPGGVTVSEATRAEFDAIRRQAVAYADSVYGEFTFAAALIGMISELDRVGGERGEDELVLRVMIVVAIGAFEERWQERSEQ